ncbi:hypothetical protein CDEF62S_01826 [Castellaniella defragrans]
MVADVVGRVVFNAPVKGTPEIVSTSIVFICFIQAGYAIRSGGMVNVNAFVKHLPPTAQSWMQAAGALLGTTFFGLICWTSFGFAVTAWVANEFTGEGRSKSRPGRRDSPSWPGPRSRRAVISSWLCRAPAMRSPGMAPKKKTSTPWSERGTSCSAPSI